LLNALVRAELTSVVSHQAYSPSGLEILNTRRLYVPLPNFNSP
jgi:hypothetical protein